MEAKHTPAPITLTFSAEQDARLRALAERRGVPLETVIREAIRLLAERERETQPVTAQEEVDRS